MHAARVMRELSGSAQRLDMLQLDCTPLRLRLLPARLDAPFRGDDDFEKLRAV
ncbi:hypothetical protein [Xanthomonas axonopodis]|uniref:hypothetical protein n=1 Tax=Xanthomonas axonopodis TaxID=53413 RepID=UPI0014837144|nr:hypothetical protein [Xanthomonas axonopodis]